MTGLLLAGIAKTYPGAARPAVEGFDLAVEAGSLTALLGPSGSGKTTVMKLIAGLIASDAGSITLGGRSILGLPPERRGVVMVFQNPLLFPHLTLAANVGFGLRMRGLPAPEVAVRVAEMLERVQLTGLGARSPLELSGGQQQRAALARALVLRPDLLLLDEPLSNLDPGLRDEMGALIRNLQRETGVTMLVVTHDQAEAVVLADSVALLLDGRVAQHARPEVIYRQPATLAVARFFGGVNFLAGQAAGGVFQSAIGALPLPPGTPDGGGWLTIRPEAVRVGPGLEAREARVLGCSFLGSQSRITLSLGGVSFQVLTDPATASALLPGQTVGVTLPTEALWLVPDRASADRTLTGKNP